MFNIAHASGPPAWALLLPPFLVPTDVLGMSHPLDGGSIPELMWNMQPYENQANFVWPSFITTSENNNINLSC